MRKKQLLDLMITGFHMVNGNYLLARENLPVEHFQCQITVEFHESLFVFCFLMASVLGVGLGLAGTEQTLWWFPPLSGQNIQQEPKRSRYHKELHSSKKSYQQKCSSLMVGHLPSIKLQKHTFHSRKSRLI